LCDSPHSLVLVRLAACTNTCAVRRIRLPTCGSPHTTAHVRLAAIINTCAARRIRLHPCGSPQFVAHVRLAALSNTCAARRIMTCAACHNVHTICVCSCFGFGGASVFVASVFSPTTTSHVTECWVCSFVRHAGSWWDPRKFNRSPAIDVVGIPCPPTSATCTEGTEGCRHIGSHPARRRVR
jgi:hypothetical protein